MDLRQDPIAPLIIRIALPASIGMVFSTMLNVTDTFYAGMLSATALAALSLSGPVFFLVMTLGIGISQATNALVGNALGAEDEPGAARMAWQAVSFALLVTLIGAAIAWQATPWLFAMMGGEAPYLEPALQYMRIVLLGAAFFSLAVVINAILNTRGDTKSFRNAQIAAFIANLGLDPLFMFTFGMGVAGVAVATVLLQAGVVAFLFTRALKLDFMRVPGRADLRPRADCYRMLAGQSLPASASMLLVAVGSLIIMAFVTAFGEPVVAAYGIALRLEQLLLLPVIGINIAALSLTGVNNGARRFRRVRETHRLGTRYALMLMLAGAGIILLLAEPLMALFTDDARVLAEGVRYLRFEAFILPAYALTFVSAAVLQGLKRPRVALAYNLIRQVLAQYALFYLAVSVLQTDITGIWWSVLVINWVLGLAIAWHVLRLLPADEPLVPGDVLKVAP